MLDRNLLVCFVLGSLAAFSVFASGPPTLENADPVTRVRAAGWVDYHNYKIAVPADLGTLVALDAVNTQIQKHPELDVNQLFDHADRARSVFNESLKRSQNVDGRSSSLAPSLVTVMESAAEAFGPFSDLVKVFPKIAQAAATGYDYLNAPADHRYAAFLVTEAKDYLSDYRVKILEESAILGLSDPKLTKLFNALVLPSAPLAAPLGSLPGDFGRRDLDYEKHVTAERLAMADNSSRLNAAERERQTKIVADDLSKQVKEDLRKLGDWERRFENVREEQAEEVYARLQQEIEADLAAGGRESVGSWVYLTSRLFSGGRPGAQKQLENQLNQVANFARAAEIYKGRMAKAAMLGARSNLSHQDALRLMGPRPAEALSAALTAEARSLASKKLAKEMSTMATMNFIITVVEIGMSLIMPAGEDPIQAVIEALRTVNDSVKSHHREMVHRLDFIDGDLAALTTLVTRKMDQVLSNQREERGRWELDRKRFGKFNDRIRVATAFLNAQAREGAMAEFADISTTVNGYVNATTRLPLTGAEIRTYSDKLARCAQHSASGEVLAHRGLIIPVDRRNDTFFDDIYHHFTGSFWSFVDPLAHLAADEYANQGMSLRGADPTRVTNAAAWSWCSLLNARLASLDWTSYSAVYTPDRWQADIEVGERLKAQLAKLGTEDQNGVVRANQHFLPTLVDDLEVHAQKLISLVEAKRTQFENEKLGGYRIGDAEKNVPHYGEVHLNGQLFQPYKTAAIVSRDPQNQPLVLPNAEQTMGALRFIPSEAYLAHHLGLGHLSVYFDVYIRTTREEKVSSGTDYYGKLAWDFRAVFHSKDTENNYNVAKVTLESEEVIFGSKRRYKQSGQTPRSVSTPIYTYRENFEGGIKEGGELVNPEGGKYSAKLVKQDGTKIMNRLLELKAGSPEVEQWPEGNKEKLVNEISGLFRGPLNRLSGLSALDHLLDDDIEQAAHRVDAAKTLLESYVALTLPRTIGSNAEFHSSLFGKGLSVGALPGGDDLRNYISGVYGTTYSPEENFLDLLLPQVTKVQKTHHFEANSEIVQRWIQEFYVPTFSGLYTESFTVVPAREHFSIKAPTRLSVLYVDTKSAYKVDPSHLGEGVRIETRSGQRPCQVVDAFYQGKAYELRVYETDEPGTQQMNVIVGDLKSAPNAPSTHIQFQRVIEKNGEVATARKGWRKIPEGKSIDYVARIRERTGESFARFRRELTTVLGNLKVAEGVPLIEDALDKLKAMKLMHLSDR